MKLSEEYKKAYEARMRKYQSELEMITLRRRYIFWIIFILLLIWLSAYIIYLGGVHNV